MMSVLLTRDLIPRKMIKEKEYIIMKGFVKNEGERGVFTLQRRLNPGSTLSFDDAYFTSEEVEQGEEKVTEAVAPARGAGTVMKRKATTVNKSSITPNTIIEAAFPEAHDLIEKCADRNVLKKALALSQHFSKKDEHMRHLMRRLEQVY
jgi:hypothetical protein